MVKKLRRKFILINMLFVLVLSMLTVFTLLLIHLNNMGKENEMILQNIIQNVLQNYDSEELSNGLLPLPKISHDYNTQTNATDFKLSFVTEHDQNQELYNILVSQISAVDKNFALEAAKKAVSSDADMGYLFDLQLAFMKQSISNGTKIAFIDISYQIQSIHRIVSIGSLFFLVIIIAFVFISIFLSRLALRPVEIALQQQNEFIANASHELKTPLTVILANLRIVRSHLDAANIPESKWLLNTQAEAERMKELLENLLFLAQADSEKTNASMERFSISELLWNCLLPFEPIAFEHGITMQENIEENLFIFGDSRQIRQLITILADNACKYAGGEKQILVSLQANSDKIVLIVQNTGTPIPKEDLPHIFERFYRADKSRSRDAGGYGLGLSIAKTIVKHHHGKISVTSNEMFGTSFSVTFPKSSK